MAKYEKWLEPDNLLLLEAWARNGLNDEQIAHNIGVRRETLYDWKKKHSNISNALTRGREVTDIIMENALYKNGLGHKVTLKKPMKVRKEEMKGKVKIVTEEVVYVDEEVYIPPNEKAEEFWLKNRDPEKWREKVVTQTESDKTLEKAIKILGGVSSVIN